MIPKEFSQVYDTILKMADEDVEHNLLASDEMLEFQQSTKEAGLYLLILCLPNVHISYLPLFFTAIRSLEDTLFRIEFEKLRRKWWIKLI